MPFYDEYGHAIITPKTRTTYQTAKVESIAPTTTARKSSRTRGGITKGKTTTTTKTSPTVTKSPLTFKETTFTPPMDRVTAKVESIAPTTTARRRKLEGTQEFADTVVQPTKQPTTVMTPKEKLHFVKGVTGHVEPEIPEQIKDLGPGATQDYFKTVSKVQMGFLPPDVGQAQLQTGVETRLREGSLPTSIRWMKEHGTFTSDDKAVTWQELKKEYPQIEMKRVSGEFVLYEKPVDYTAWQKEQYKGMHPVAAGIRRGTATLLGGFGSFDYMRAGHTGDPTKVSEQQKKIDAVINRWEYDTSQQIKQNDVLGVVSSIPAVKNIVLPYATGVGVGALFKGAYGASAALAKHGFKHTSTALKLGVKGTGVGLGTIAIGTVGYDVYTTHQQDPDKATLKALAYGTQFASFGRGMKTAMDVSLKTVKAKQLTVGQPNVTFKGGYRPGSSNLVGRGRAYSKPSLAGRGKSYTPMKSVVYTPTSPGVVAGKAKAQFENWFDTKDFIYKKPTMASGEPYKIKGLNELLGKGKIKKGLLDRKPFFEITKPSGVVKIFKQTGTDTFTPTTTGKNTLLVKTKSVVSPVKTKASFTPAKTITLEAPTTTTVGKISFGKMPMMGFSKIKGGGILSKVWGRRLSPSMLAASESGVYTGVHAHWWGVAPIITSKIYTPSAIPSTSVYTIGKSYLQEPLSSVSIDRFGLSHSIKSTDVISTSINTSDARQILDKVTTPVSRTSSISISDTNQLLDTIQTPISITSPITLSNTKQALDAITLSDTKQTFDTITTPVSITTTRSRFKLPSYKPPPCKPYYKPPPTLPPLKLPDFTTKKKKKSGPFKKWTKGYRFRTWKVPSMKDFMKGGMR